MPPIFSVKSRATKDSFIYEGTPLRIDVARGNHCQCPGCTHPLERGTAYIVRDHNRKDAHGQPLEIEVGPTCVKKYDPAFDPKRLSPDFKGDRYEGISLPNVPDVTKGVGSLVAFKERPSTRMNASRGRGATLTLEQCERLDDEAYLVIWGQRLPALNCGFIPPKCVADAVKDYERDPAHADLSQVRDLRQYHERCDRHNSLETLQICYAKAVYLARCMKPGTPEYKTTTRLEQPLLPRYMNQLRRTHHLTDTQTDHLNRIILRAHPRAKPFEIAAPDTRQENLFEIQKPTAVSAEEDQTLFLLDPNITTTIGRRPAKAETGNGTLPLFRTG